MGRLPKCRGCKKEIAQCEKDWGIAEKHSGYWWHNDCYARRDEFKKAEENKPKEVTVEQQIHQYMKNLCGDSYVKSRIDKQYKEFINQGKTPQGILATLQYWYEKKHRDPQDSYGGIGIVEYVYNDAQEYYKIKKQKEEKLKEVPQSVIDNITKKQNAETGVCFRREKVTKPRGVYMFHLE